MSLAVETTKCVYVGSGSTGPFPYNFKIFSATDLSVTKYDLSGTAISLTYATHYTVSGVGVTGGGNVTLLTALTTGYKLVIKRNMGYLQSTNFTANNKFSAATMNNALDKITMLSQQLHELGNRAYQLPEWYTTGPVYTESATDIASITTAVQQYVLNLYPFVTPQAYGAVGDGLADDTLALQEWLDSGYKSLYLPAGRYNFTALVIPNTYNLKIWGSGTSSMLVQKGTGITWTTKATLVQTCDQDIYDLAFDGTAGTGHTISTQFVSQMHCANLWFFNVPTGYASMFINGNPTDGTYAHDVTAHNIKIYHQNSGNGSAGIYLGAKHSDCLIDGLIFKGNFTTDYGILAAVGAETTRVTNAHIYDAKINNVRLLGSNSYFLWNGVTFDNSLQDLVYLADTSKNTFTGCFFENIRNSYSGIVYDNSYYNVINNGVFKAYSTTPLHAVNQTNIVGTGANIVSSGSVDTVIAGITTPFVSSTGSLFRGISGFATQNHGTSSAISTGATIAHGLAITPTWSSVVATDGTAVTWTVDATNLTVTFSGGGSKTFYWNAEY